MTQAQARYAVALLDGPRSPAQLARVVYAGNHAMTKLRPGHGRGRNGNAAAAAGALGNLAAGRMLRRMIAAGYVYDYDGDFRRYALTVKGRTTVQADYPTLIGATP